MNVSDIAASHQAIKVVPSKEVNLCQASSINELESNRIPAMLTLTHSQLVLFALLISFLHQFKYSTSISPTELITFCRGSFKLVVAGRTD